jgi:reversibly glycosylated polypeptide/UDP-arabinopyranose mutase
MNLAFRRELIPAMYFPLMGEGQPFDRFDDIWAGILVKKVLDTLGARACTGLPVVEHTRASNPLNNLVAEAPGILYNESFWRIVDSIPSEKSDTVAGIYDHLAGWLQSDSKLGSYLNTLGKAMFAWLEICR